MGKVVGGHELVILVDWLGKILGLGTRSWIVNLLLKFLVSKFKEDVSKWHLTKKNLSQAKCCVKNQGGRF